MRRISRCVRAVDSCTQAAAVNANRARAALQRGFMQSHSPSRCCAGLSTTAPRLILAGILAASRSEFRANVGATIGASCIYGSGLRMGGVPQLYKLTSQTQEMPLPVPVSRKSAGPAGFWSGRRESNP